MTNFRKEAWAIVKKSRHSAISATGERYEPINILVKNLHLNITSALQSAYEKGKLKGWNEAVEYMITLLRGMDGEYSIGDVMSALKQLKKEGEK